MLGDLIPPGLILEDAGSFCIQIPKRKSLFLPHYHQSNIEKQKLHVTGIVS